MRIPATYQGKPGELLGKISKNDQEPKEIRAQSEKLKSEEAALKIREAAIERREAELLAKEDVLDLAIWLKEATTTKSLQAVQHKMDEYKIEYLEERLKIVKESEDVAVYNMQMYNREAQRLRRALREHEELAAREVKVLNKALSEAKELASGRTDPKIPRGYMQHDRAPSESQCCTT